MAEFLKYLIVPQFSIVVIVLTLSVQVLAKVKFNCYDNPNLWVTGHQAGQVHCASDKSEHATDAEDESFCSYPAICEVLEEDEKPTVLSPAQVKQLTQNLMAMSNSDFRSALVSCKGNGLVRMGKNVAVSCPELKDCTQDLAFNVAPATINRKFMLGDDRPNGPVIIKSDKWTKGRSKR